MIRLILVALFLVVFLILSLPVQLILWLFWKAGFKDSTEIISLRIVQFAFHVLIFLCGTRVTVIGEENIPEDRAVLFVGNHNSYFDVVLTYARMRRRTGYIAKKELLKIPSLSTWMKFLHCLFLDRTDMRAGMQMILDAIALIKSGVSMFIFPEGTRNVSEHETDMLEFKAGSLKIADKSGCPVIPVAMTGTANIFERQAPFIKRANVTIRYGTPIDPTALDKDQRKHLASYVQNTILEMLKEQEVTK